jgi:hypothetical protein
MALALFTANNVTGMLHPRHVADPHDLLNHR